MQQGQPRGIFVKKVDTLVAAYVFASPWKRNILSLLIALIHHLRLLTRDFLPWVAANPVYPKSLCEYP